MKDNSDWPGIATGAGSGGAASVGSASMSPMSGAMASGGVLNGLSASEGNYTGQMEYMSGMLGLIGAAMDGLSTAASVMSQTGGKGMVSELVESFAKLLTGPKAGGDYENGEDLSKAKYKNTIQGDKLIRSDKRLNNP